MNRWGDTGEREGKALNIAHRGASAYAPENTIPAFMLAARMGAQAIELDVHLTRDRQLVVCHDADVSRTTNGSGAIHDLDLATLQMLDAGLHFSGETNDTPLRGQGLSIPTLAEVFGAIPNSLLVNVEMKATLSRPSNPALRRLVVQTISGWLGNHADQNYHERILLSSFDWSLIDAVRADGLAIPTAYLVSPQADLRGALAATVERGHAAIHPHESLITEQSRSVLEEAHRRGLSVNVWTVDDADRMRELLALGVDGIVTNRPDHLAEILAQH